MHTDTHTCWELISATFHMCSLHIPRKTWEMFSWYSLMHIIKFVLAYTGSDVGSKRALVRKNWYIGAIMHTGWCTWGSLIISHPRTPVRFTERISLCLSRTWTGRLIWDAYNYNFSNYSKVWFFIDVAANDQIETLQLNHVMAVTDRLI